MCVLAVCVGVLAVCVPRVRGRRVGVSACRRVCRLVCWCVGSGKSPLPQYPSFFSKKCLYTEGHHHTQVVLSRGMMDFLLGGFGRFFAFFRDLTRAPARPNWTPAFKPAAPKAEDTARPGRNHGARLARLVRPGRFY